MTRVGSTDLPNLRSPNPDALRPAPARSAKWRRLLRGTLYVKLGLVFLILIAIGGLYLRLAAGPLDLARVSDRLSTALAERIGPGWTVSVAGTALELSGSRPAMRASGLDIRNPAGLLVVRAPFALVSLDPLSLLVGQVSPREVEFRDLQLRALLRPDGSLAFVPSDGAPAVPATEPASPAVGGDRSTVSTAFASLLGPLLQSTSLIGALDRAVVKDARLTLVGPDGRERAVYRRLDATFERHGGGDRRVALELDGLHGPWRVRGDVKGGSERTADLTAEGVPLADLLLFSGLADTQVASDLKLGGRLTGEMTEGRLTRLDGRFESTAGMIRRQNAPPIRIDRALGEASWDEARRVLRLPILEVASGKTQVKLAGELTPGPEGAWRLALLGREVAIEGVADDDPAFRIDEIAATVDFKETGLALERLTVKGDGLDLAVSGASVPGPAGSGIVARIEARATDVRRMLRLWPDALAPDLRAYLAENLKAGTVERLALRSALDRAGLENAIASIPIPDDALSVEFNLRDGRLQVADGLPPLRGLSIDGRITGTKAELASRGGRIDVGDGRRLAFLDASYVHADYDVKDSVAQIGFRVAGGADAVAAFLRYPLMREVGAPDLDPTSIKGRAEFRVSLPLPVHQLGLEMKRAGPGKRQRMPDLAISLTGALTDVSADRLLGRERIEGANLTATFEGGAFGLKGEARIGGSPATIDVQKPRGAAGEVTVALTLDEAARARRSLPVAPQLAGPVPVRLQASLATGPKAVARIEADLSRAAVDGLLPGWSKPAGRPGRLSFLIGEGDAPDLRDIVLDAGPVQIRGGASFNALGGLEKADLPTLKLSPGDDMRAQIDRAATGYRLALKGNVGDARPVLRWITGGPPGSKGATGPSRDLGDFDVDVSLNILSGHNDEALTGVTVKLSSRARELRSLQFNGRFRQALVDVQIAKRDGGAPILSVASGDAGATLRFLDLYKRMVGGRLAINARSNESSQEGRIEIDEFALKGEPALRSITAQGVPMNTTDDRGLAPIARGEVDQVLFTKLQADFRRSAAKAEFKEVTIYGSQVGFNLNGFVDFARDRMDVSGTFVPAYILNNAFSQVPVVGMLLGGPNEGLFAIDFRVAGPTSGPTLTVNPLTAVAPGILRKLFGWMLTEGSAPPDAAGAGAAPARRGRPATPPRAAEP